MILTRVVDRSVIDNLRGQIDPLLLSALNTGQGELSIQNVYDAVLEGKMQLWVIFDEGRVIAACVTTIIDTMAGKRVCRVILLGGSQSRSWGYTLNEWLIQWSKVNKCHTLEAYVTERMRRHLVNLYGYRDFYRVVGFDLWNEGGVLH